MKRKSNKFLLLILTILLLSTYYYFVHYKGYNPFDTINGKSTTTTGETASSIETSIEVTSYVTSNGDFNITFCPSQACLNQYLNVINSARTKLDCAVYELDHPQIQAAIRNKALSIQVRIVTDSDYLKEFNEPYVKTDKSGLMHNKFCLADNSTLLAGSANPTENDMGKNNNNVIVTTSKDLITNYQDEFDEMWSGIFKKGTPTKTPDLILGDPTNQNSIIKISNYFCPEDHCEDHVVAELNKATSSIDCMVFSFTSDPIGNALALKHTENIPIRCIFETRQESEFSEYEKLKYQNLDVHLDGNKYTMHHKVFIIDNKTVITGSFNPSAGGNTRNDENIMIIHSKSIATLYTEEFMEVYGAAIVNETIKE